MPPPSISTSRQFSVFSFQSSVVSRQLLVFSLLGVANRQGDSGSKLAIGPHPLIMPAASCGQKMRTGNHLWFPVSFPDFFAPWQRPRSVASSAHRKSGVVICLTYASPVESFLLPSAYFPFTPLHGKLQASSSASPFWFLRLILQPLASKAVPPARLPRHKSLPRGAGSIYSETRQGYKM